MGASVVVVDDDDDIANLLLSGLRRAEITAVRARDGGEGVRTVVLEQPRVVLMDWMMPVKDGIQACREIRGDAHLPQPHIIMITARSRVADENLARSCGVDEFIAKPFRPRILVEQLKELLAS